MKTLWLYFVKNYIRVGLFFYFKSIKVNDIRNIPNGKPLMILSNHQNALLDALLIATRIKGTAYFLTRASVFKKAIVSDILRSLNLLPIYRIRDGYANLGRNESLFNTISGTLNENKTVVIFPEGNHSLARRVRPLSKGFTRIVFNTLKTHQDIDLKLQPIGLNYDKPKELGSSVTIYCGLPIDAQNFAPTDTSNTIQETNNLKITMQTAMSKLTTNVPTENYDAILQQLNELNIDFLDPIAVNNCIESRFQDCQDSRPKRNELHKKVFKFLLILCVFLPFIIWKFLIQPKIEEMEFLATFRFVVGITLVPIFMVLVCVVMFLFLGFKTMMVYLICVLVMAILAIKT